MNTVISRASQHEADDFPRTEWFRPEQLPTVPGVYEARTGGGHVFKRTWTGSNWLNAITGLVSTAPCDWRGIAPYSITVALYPVSVRSLLHPVRDSIPDDMSFIGSSLAQSIQSTS